MSEKKQDKSLARGYLNLLIRVIIIAAVFWLIFNYVFLITRCHGQGMYPAVKDGDLCVVFRTGISRMTGQKLAQGDIVVYKLNGKRYFGRVTATAGDTVAVDGRVTVNGTPEGNDILYTTETGTVLEFPFQVPEETVFVLGDFRTDTQDSRDFGSIPLEYVEGKLITLLRRRGL